MDEFEVTFRWPNDDWTWIYVEAKDFQSAMFKAMEKCPDGCRVKSILPIPSDQRKANEANAARRREEVR
jgi:hypothetical protein